MKSFDHLVSEIHHILSGVKLSIEPTMLRRRKSLPVNEIANIVGQLEQARFKFFSTNQFIDAEVEKEVFDDSIIQLLSDLDTIRSTPTFEVISSFFIYRPRPIARGTKLSIPLHEPKLLDRISVFEAFEILHHIVIMINGVSNPLKLFSDEDLQPELPAEPQQKESQKAAQSLKRIVPAQKIAPVHFSIVKDRIIIENVTSHIGDRDRSNAQIAKDQILENGKAILNHLRKSNCDKRLIENIEQLHTQIDKGANVIQIGISNISFGVMSGNFKSELPDAISSMLQSHTISINMYVAQFPDWNRFSENASIAEISSEDVSTVESSAGKIIEALEANKEIAEPRVVKAFKRLKELTKDPRTANKRAVFAVVRSIENLLSNTFQYAAGYLEETAKELQKSAAKTTAQLIISIGIAGAVALSPIAAKINELSWLKNAIEIVQKQLKITK